MTRARVAIAAGILLACAGALGCARSDDQGGPAATLKDRSSGRTLGAAERSARGSEARAALNRAGSEGKYAFVLFYEGNDEGIRAARKSFQKALRSVDRSIELVEVDRSDAAEKAFIDDYSMRAVPLPVALAIAPNGAVTGAFRSQDLGNADRLKTGLASRGMQACLKALQDRKIVIVCAQGRSTARNAEAMRGVEEFKADARYGPYTTVLTIDPSDAAETSFLSQLKVDPKSSEATTVLIVPPSYALGTLRGATTKASFMRLLAAAAACGSGGCGPTGCAPTGCAPVKK